MRGTAPGDSTASGPAAGPGKGPAAEPIPPEEATGQYLRILRNAGHGYSGQNDRDRRRDKMLLMSHTGPDAFALLPYLYWLDVLADPEVLRRKLVPRWAVPTAVFTNLDGTPLHLA